MTKYGKHSWENMFSIRIHKHNIEYGHSHFYYYESCVIISKLYDDVHNNKIQYFEEYYWCNKQLIGKYQLKSSIFLFLLRQNWTTLIIYVVENVVNHRGQYAFQGILLQRLITAFKLFMYIMHSYLTLCIMNSQDINHIRIYNLSLL